MKAKRSADIPGGGGINSAVLSHGVALQDLPVHLPSGPNSFVNTNDDLAGV